MVSGEAGGGRRFAGASVLGHYEDSREKTPRKERRRKAFYFTGPYGPA
jgi:hypothetical protein